jgi:hypothetical protein
MKFSNLLLVTLLLGYSSCFSQVSPQATAGIDFGAGINSNAFSPSILYHEETGFYGQSWLKVGVGMRAWGLYGGRTDLKSPSGADLIDTLKYQNISANGLSFVVGLNFRIWKVDVGANTDLFGFVYGSKRSGFYPKNGTASGGGAAFYNKYVTTSPPVFNFLPAVFQTQNGQSEIYARVWISRQVGVKVGYLGGRIAYSTNRVNGEKVYLDKGQRRFSNIYGMPYAAISISISD